MSAHTPGPWVVGYLDANGQRVVKTEHIEICTCWHHSVMAIEQEMEANARLIAAAPELLESLRNLLGQTNNIEVLGEWEAEDINLNLRKKTRAKVNEVLAGAYAVIKKATGAPR